MLPHYGILCFKLEIAGFHKLQIYFTWTQQETNKWLDDGDGKSSKSVPNFFFIKTPNAWFVFRCQYLILISSHMSRKDMDVRTHTGKETAREREGENKKPLGF